MLKVNYKQLTKLQKKALDAASEVLKNAYNPYSRFYVGATLISTDGELISGTNFENAAYGSTICAERAAVLRANSMGVRRFSAIAIIARGDGFDAKRIIAPCGSCRQVLYELSQISGKKLEIIMSTTKMDKIILATIDELLPLGFGPLDLGVDIRDYK
jgi:cytidine deaminase